MQQTPCGLSPWADGREMWVKCAVVVMIPVHPGTFTTPTHFTRHAPTFGPRIQFAWSRGTTLAGCHQTPNPSTTEATWARVSVCKEPWHLRTTITQILWSNSWAWLAKCVGVLSIPGRTSMLKNPHESPTKPYFQTKDSMSWSSFATMAPCRLRIWHGLHQWAKHQGSDESPLGESAANSLRTEFLGRWSVNVGETCGYCDCPCAPRDLHNTHTFHPT